MALLDHLPLDTPTLLDENDDVEVWGTRTTAGAHIEHRPKEGSLAQHQLLLQDHLVGAIEMNSYFLVQAHTASHDDLVRQVERLTRQVQALVRLQYGRLDERD